MARIVLGPFRLDLLELARAGIQTAKQQYAKRNRAYLEFKANGHVYYAFWDRVDLPFVRRLKFLGDTKLTKVEGLEHVVGRRLDPRSLPARLDVEVVESSDGSTGPRSWSPTAITEAWLWQFVDKD